MVKQAIKNSKKETKGDPNQSKSSGTKAIKKALSTSADSKSPRKAATPALVKSVLKAGEAGTCPCADGKDKAKQAKAIVKAVAKVTESSQKKTAK